MKTNFSLSTIGNGGLEEMFQRDLEIISKNINDLNTAPTKARSITLKIDFKPDKSRGNLLISYNSKASIAPFEENGTQAYLDTEDGIPAMAEHEKGVIKGQMKLFGEEEAAPVANEDVVQINDRKININ